MAYIEDRVYLPLDFFSYLSSSLHQNVIRFLGDTPPGYYFNSPYNLAFHYLTSGKSLSSATHIVMVVSSNKFIPIPKFTTPTIVAMEPFERFERDLDLKVFFAGDDVMEELPKTELYVRSTFGLLLPPLKNIILPLHI